MFTVSGFLKKTTVSGVSKLQTLRALCTFFTELCLTLNLNKKLHLVSSKVMNSHAPSNYY